MYENFTPEISSIHAMIRVNGRVRYEGNHETGRHGCPWNYRSSLREESNEQASTSKLSFLS